MKNLSTKQLLNIIVQGLSGIFAVGALITQLAADKEDKEDMYEEVEEKLKKKFVLIPNQNLRKKEDDRNI